MSGGGGKGGQTQTQIDPALAAAARDAIEFAGAAAAIPYSPNRGVQIADFTPQQKAAMESSNMAAAAFGMPTGAAPAMPAVETSAGGIRGFSTGAEFDAMKNKSVTPGLQAAIAQLFANPNTGNFDQPGGPLMRGTENDVGGGKGASTNPSTNPSVNNLVAFARPANERPS